MSEIHGGLLLKVETATGSINGSNVDFNTSFNYVPSTLEVLLNGLELVSGVEFIETGSNSFQLSDAPIGGASPDILLVRYQKS